jgi:hypothetical protein
LYFLAGDSQWEKEEIMPEWQFSFAKASQEPDMMVKPSFITRQ